MLHIRPGNPKECVVARSRTRDDSRTLGYSDVGGLGRAFSALDIWDPPYIRDCYLVAPLESQTTNLPLFFGM